MSKKNQLDQYYTKESAVDTAYCLIEKYYEGETLLEPSVGQGAFYNYNYNIRCYDIDPKISVAIKQDFLKVNPKDFEGCFAVGNPPFGFCSRLAIKFINHCALSCNKICFILPNTFKKELFFDKHIDKSLHLMEVVPLPKNSFILDGDDYDVPCSIFYIEKRDTPREKLFWKEYLFQSEVGVNVRRAGGKAGKVVDEYTKSSTYRLSTNDIRGVKYFLDKYKDEISKVASYTAGVKCISVDELNYIITKGESYEQR